MPATATPIAATPAEIEIPIYGSISSWNISARSVSDLLKQNPDAKTVRVRINSGGGSVFEGAAIYNMLAKHPAKKIIEIEGLAASAASWVAMAGDERIIGLGGFFMIHECQGFSDGPASEHEKTAALLRKMNTQQIDIYAKRSKLSRADIAKAIEAETWYTAAEALKAGFVTSTSVAVGANAMLNAMAKMADCAFRHAPPGVEQAMRSASPTAAARPEKLSASDIEQIIANLSTDVEPDHTPSSPLLLSPSDEPTHNGKTWAEMTNMEKHNLANEDRAKFDAMRNASGGAPTRAFASAAPSAATPVGKRLTHNGKTWTEMTTMEKHALAVAERPKFLAMRDAPTYLGKTWAEMTSMDKHALYNDDRETYEAMRDAQGN